MAPVPLEFPEPLQSLLKTTTVQTILSRAKHEPVAIDAELSVIEASNVLAKYGISSAPVRTEAGAYVGMFDFGDLAHLLIGGVRARDAKEAAVPEAAAGGFPQLDALLEAGLSATSPVKLVSDLSKMNPLVEIAAEASVLDAIQLLVERDAHRVCVFDKPSASDGARFVGMLSFSDITKFLHVHVAEIEALVAPSVEALGLLDKKVVTVHGDRPVVHALELMVNLRVSSVAVVDEHDGALLTAITLTDCKNLVAHANHLRRLRVDCREFASMVRANAALDKVHYGREAFPFYAVHRDAPVKTCVAKLVAVRAHRLFVVHDGKPVGVISLSDIVKALALKPHHAGGGAGGAAR
mmetsp:Transcript_25476/g.101528  ORF Transcript_25476/g.101528 Transcript_25476/m.101528 type:complete len:352 (+) Transcript_25476:299-1354(+)